MAKYSFEFKMKVVQDYLSGEGGYPFLVKKYHLKSDAQIKVWVNAYRHWGEEGLKRSRQNKVYTSNFKLNAVQWYLKGEISYSELASKLQMNNPSLLARWVKAFREHGPNAFVPKLRGRPRKEAPNIVKAVNTETSKDEALKKLQEENLYLRMENEYLKGLRRLRMEQQAKEKPDLFKTSTDNSSSPSKPS